MAMDADQRVVYFATPCSGSPLARREEPRCDVDARRSELAVYDGVVVEREKRYET